MDSEKYQKGYVNDVVNFKHGKMRKALLYVKRWLFLNVWCSHLYRPTMKILHRMGLHYAPARVPIEGSTNKREHWCEWCGLRGTTYKSTPLQPPPAS